MIDPDIHFRAFEALQGRANDQVRGLYHQVNGRPVDENTETWLELMTVFLSNVYLNAPAGYGHEQRMQQVIAAALITTLRMQSLIREARGEGLEVAVDAHGVAARGLDSLRDLGPNDDPIETFCRFAHEVVVWDVLRAQSAEPPVQLPPIQNGMDLLSAESNRMTAVLAVVQERLELLQGEPPDEADFDVYVVMLCETLTDAELAVAVDLGERVLGEVNDNDLFDDDSDSTVDIGNDDYVTELDDDSDEDDDMDVDNDNEDDNARRPRGGRPF